ncbi:DeoR/GlpR family DNA-binding transcription regulator [Streptococcaceae bacterium ESL0729]|nr:DeoR/GlpR family DNA-binding transcription regulator [Streptococcaceae bacterium ESL0729]
MLANDRKKVILSELSSRGSVTIEYLCGLTGASVSTLRRDLTGLERQGKLVRVHGGAEPIKSLSGEASISEKTVKNVQKKEMIADMALTHLSDGDVIFLDAGSTTGMMIEGLQRFNGSLTIVTNSVTHASKLIKDHITIYILGGFIKNLTDAVIGSDAVQQMEQFNFTKAFLGANAIGDEYISTPDMEEANIKQAALKRAQETYVLADRSKFNKLNLINFAKVSEVIILTNS